MNAPARLIPPCPIFHGKCVHVLSQAPSPRSDVQGRDLAMVTEIVRNPCSFALFSQERCLALLERLCTCPRASSCSCLRGPFARCDLPLPCRIHPAGYPCAGQAWPGPPVRVRSVYVACYTVPRKRGLCTLLARARFGARCLPQASASLAFPLSRSVMPRREWLLPVIGIAFWDARLGESVSIHEKSEKS